MGKIENLEVIYEDNHIIVCVKPVGVLSQADKTGDIDMLTLVKQYVKEKYNKPGEVYLGLVHRLDRPVGGVMVFARTSKAAARLSEQIRQKGFKKGYLAIVRGVPKDSEGTFKDFLIKDEKSNIVTIASPRESGAKEAVLNYKVIKSIKYENKDLTLVSVDLITGRSHQIRVQFASRGMPLLGDMKYGGNSDKGSWHLAQNDGVALWSNSISLVHPTQKTVMRFEKSIPCTNLWSLFE